MTPSTSGLIVWLTNVFVQATVLLALVVAVLPLIRQAALRITLAWGTLAGLLLVAVLAAFPHWTLVVLPDWTSAVHRPTRPPGDPDWNLLAARKTWQPPEVDESAADAAKPEAKWDREAAIDEGTNDAFAIGSTESSEEFPVPEPLQNAEPDATRLDSGIPEFDTTAPIAHATPEFATRRWSETASAVWTAGACLAILWIGLGAWRTRRLDLAANDAPEWMRGELRHVVPASRQQPRLRISSRIDAALACGTFRPAILLPDQNVHPAEPNGIRAALAHEWAHIAHGDLWLLALERVLLPVYFAHPLFWVLRRRVRHDQELLADAAAAGDHPIEYAEALLAWAKSAPRQHRADVLAALSLWNNPCTLARRIEMLLESRHPISGGVSRLWRGVTLTIIVSLACVLASLTFESAALVADDPQPGSAERPHTANAGGTATSEGAVAAGTTAQSSAERDTDSSTVPEIDMRSNVTDPNPSASYRSQLNIVYIEIDQVKLAEEKSTPSELLRTLSGTQEDIQFDRGLIVARSTYENLQTFVQKLTRTGIGTVQAEPRLAVAARFGSALRQAERPAESRSRGLDCGVEFEHKNLRLCIQPLLFSMSRDNTVRTQIDVTIERPKSRRAPTTIGPRDLFLSSGHTIRVGGAVPRGHSLIIAMKPEDDELGSIELLAITPTNVSDDRAMASPLESTVRSPQAGMDAVLRATDKLEFTQRLQKKGYVANSEVDAARADLEKAKQDFVVAQAQAQESSEVESLRKQVQDLQAQIRLLRQSSPASPSGAPSGRDEANVLDPEQELLRLDVKEAEVNYAAAKAEYDQAQQLAAQKVISQGELTARKLKVDRAAIALERVKVRLKAAAQRTDSGERTPEKSSLNTPTPFLFSAGNAEASRALLELDVREAELDLAAARSAYNEAAEANAKVSASVPARELSARKLAVQKAEIAVERAKLRLEAARGPAQGGKSGEKGKEGAARSLLAPGVASNARETSTKGSRNTGGAQLVLELLTTDTAPGLSAGATPRTEVEAILADWERSISGVRRLDCEFERFVYDSRSETETRSAGVIKVEGPQEAVYALLPSRAGGSVSQKLGKSRVPYTVWEGNEEGWLWTGTRVMRADMRTSTCTFAPIADEGQVPSVAAGFFLARPFLLGMPARELLEQFDVDLERRGRDEVWLSFVPRLPGIAAAWSRAILILDNRTWLPKALKLTDPSGQIDATHVFRSIVVKNEAKIGAILTEANIQTYRHTMATGEQDRSSLQMAGLAALFSEDALPATRDGRLRELQTLAVNRMNLRVVPVASADFNPQLAKQFHGGMKVTSIMRNGVAEKAGIRVGDILVGLGIWELARVEDLAYVIDHLNPLEGKPLGFHLIRADEVIRGELKPR